MAEKFLTFHTFIDPALANDFAEKLNARGIEFVLEKTPQLLDSTIMGVSSDPDIAIKLLPEDFSKGHQCLEEYYQSVVDNVDKDHYLFSFSNKELLEIISKPDEWGYLDYLLARKILADRGLFIDDQSLKKLRTQRNDTLARPEKPGFFMYFIAYLFILSSLLYAVSPISYFTDLSFFSSLISFFIGRHIFRTKKALPDGKSVYYYEPKDRQHGKNIMWLGIIVFFCAMLKYLLFSLGANSSG